MTRKDSLDIPIPKKPKANLKNWSFGLPLKKTGNKILEGLTAAENLPGNMMWIYTEAPPEDRFILFGDNRARLKTLFGKPSTTFTSEFRYYNWIFENGFALASAAGKGTRIEVPPDTTTEELKKFTMELIALLKPLAQDIIDKLKPKKP